MSAAYELIYHKELNIFNCFCGYTGLFHHCTRKIRGFIKIVSCPTDCKLCEKEADRKEYNSFVFRTCYDRLGDNPICTDCFAPHVIRH